MDIERRDSYNHAGWCAETFRDVAMSASFDQAHDKETDMKITAGVSAILLALALGLTACSGDRDMDESGDSMMENSSDAMMNQADDAGHADDADAMMSQEAAPEESAPAEGQ